MHRDPASGACMFLFRIGKANEAKGAARPEAVPAVLGRRRMGGMFFVAATDATEKVLADWQKLALSHAGTLPPRGERSARPTKRPGP